MEIQIFNTTINYSKSGKGDVLVLIAGLGTFEENLVNQIEYFKQRFTVIVFDPPGLARSEKTNKEYSMSDYAEFSRKLLVKLKVSKAIIIGISQGGAIALELGVSHPEIVKKIVVADMDSSFKMSLYLVFKLGVAILGVKGFANFMGRSLFKANKILRDKWITLFSKNDKKSLLLSCNSLKNWDITNKLISITVPVLVIASDNEIPSPAEKLRHFSSIKNLKFETMKDSGHAAYLEHSTEFNKTIDEFLYDTLLI